MEQDYWYWFDGMGFRPAEESEVPSVSEGDWWQGYEKHSSFGGEFSPPCQITILTGEKGWIINLMLEDCGLMNVLCPSAPEVLVFMKEYGTPLLAMNAQGAQEEFFTRAQEVLFDREDGLPCAQRVCAREGREREEMLRLRKLQKEKRQA